MNFLVDSTNPSIQETEPIPAVMLWNTTEEKLYAGVTGVNQWIQISAGSKGGPTGIQGNTGMQGIRGLRGVTGIQGIGTTGPADYFVKYNASGTSLTAAPVKDDGDYVTTTDRGIIQYQDGCPVWPYQELQHGDVTHGMTSYLSTNAFSRFDIGSVSRGGLRITGASENVATPPLALYALGAGACAGLPYCAIVAGKVSGTGIQALSADEVAFRVRSYTTNLLRVYGDGDCIIAKDLSVAGDATITGNLTVGSSFVMASNNTGTTMDVNAYTTVPFNYVEIDSRSEYDSAEGIFTADTSGAYAVSWATRSSGASLTAGQYWTTILSRNDKSATGPGGGAWSGSIDTVEVSTSRQLSSTGHCTVGCPAGGTLQVKVWHNASGGGIGLSTLDIENYLHIKKIS
jgi:hypothetical protein